MPSGFESMLNEAMAAVHEQRDKLMRQQRSLNEITATVRSKRRQVSATVDARGELVELMFHGQSYRHMSPEDLGRLVVQTVREARNDAQTQLWESMGDSLPPGADIDDLVNGRYDWSEAINEVLTLPKPLMELLGSPPVGNVDVIDVADYDAFVDAMTKATEDGSLSGDQAPTEDRAAGARSDGETGR